MVRDEEAGEKCQWMLHQNAANGPEWALTTAYEQPGAIREPPKSDWNNPFETIKINPP